MWGRLIPLKEWVELYGGKVDFLSIGIGITVFLLVVLIVLVAVLIFKLGKKKEDEHLVRLEEKLSFYQHSIEEISKTLGLLSVDFENKILKNVSRDLSETKTGIVEVLNNVREEIIKTKAELELNSSNTLAETKQKLSHLEIQVSGTIERINKSLTDTTTTLMKDITNTINNMHKSFGEQTAGLSGKLGEITRQLENLERISSEIKKLQDILKPPKQRGIFGEVLLENLIKDMFPKERYKFQYSIGNDKVDAAIFLENKIVPVDSKFPLDKYEDYLKGESKGFEKGIKTMIDNIASKYIKVKTGEGNTTNFALMYIPSESIWYSLFVEKPELYRYAVDKKVFPVSPNTIFSYFQMLVEGLNSFEIEENIEAVLNDIRGLKKDIEEAVSYFETLKKHLTNAASKSGETVGLLRKIFNSLSSLVK